MKFGHVLFASSIYFSLVKNVKMLYQIGVGGLFYPIADQPHKYI